MDKLNPDQLKILGLYAAESGIPPDDLLDSLSKRRKEVIELTTSKEGKYTVLAVDRFDDNYWVHDRYDTSEEALRIACELTDDSKNLASDESVATIYYAYDPKGINLGGNTWRE